MSFSSGLRAGRIILCLLFAAQFLKLHKAAGYLDKRYLDT